MSQWLAKTEKYSSQNKNIILKTPIVKTEIYQVLRLHQHPELNFSHLKTYNLYQQKLYAVLVDFREKKSEYCIIYMHGMGSNILEGSILIDFLPENVALCCFDFSSSGKSQGLFCTYGVKEHRDIEYIIKLLKKEGYNKFILWGRSMGAFASLAYTSTQTLQNQCILQILDSPFSNFQTVCSQRAKQYYGFPDFFVNYSVNLMKHNLSEHPFNPFNFNLVQKAEFCRVASLFVYNENDEVIPSQSIQQLIKAVSKNCPYERLIIEDPHNSNRCTSTFRQIFEKIKKFINTYESGKKIAKKKAINVCSFLIKKEGSSKNLTQMTDIDSWRNKRRGALFCSLSKLNRESPKKSLKYT